MNTSLVLRIQENIIILCICIAVTLAMKLIRAISLYILESKLNIGNKGLVVLPVYSNWMEGITFERILDTNMIHYKVFSLISPILLQVSVAYYYNIYSVSNKAANMCLITGLIIYVAFKLIRVYMRFTSLKHLNGNIVISFVISVLLGDIWGVYANKLLTDMGTAYETERLKRRKELEELGTRVEWH